METFAKVTLVLVVAAALLWVHWILMVAFLLLVAQEEP